MSLLVLTDRRLSEAAGRELAVTVAEAVAGGARAVLFREKDLAGDERRALGERVAEVCVGIELVVASDPLLARAIGTRTVHLSAADPWPEDGDLTLGRSCHSAEELAEAETHGVTYATVSPVFPTTSKPGYGPTLGIDGLRCLTEGTAVSVFALGGIGPGNMVSCLDAGAVGVAVMGAVMAAEDPAAVVAALLDAEAQR